jgi:hypothetical protein
MLKVIPMVGTMFVVYEWSKEMLDVKHNRWGVTNKQRIPRPCTLSESKHFAFLFAAISNNCKYYDILGSDSKPCWLDFTLLSRPQPPHWEYYGRYEIVPAILLVARRNRKDVGRHAKKWGNNFPKTQRPFSGSPSTRGLIFQDTCILHALLILLQ